MPPPDTLAAQLARCVELFRDETSREQQKLEFRALMTLLQADHLTVRDDGGRVSVNGSPADGLAVGALAQRLALHGVAEIALPQAPPPGDVFELIRALAGQPGNQDIPAKFQMAGTGMVSVTLAPVTLSPEAGPAPGSAPTPKRPSGLGTEGILRGEPMTDIASPEVRVPGVSSITHDPPPPSSESALPARGNVKPSGALPGVAAPPGASAPRAAPQAPSPAPTPPPGPPPVTAAPPVAPPTPAAPPPPAAPPVEGRPIGLAGTDGLATAFAAAPARAQSADALLAELENNPESPNVGDLLAELGRLVEEAGGTKNFERVVTIIAALVRFEQRVPEGSARRNYGIALRRMYNKVLLKGIAGLLSDPKYQANAVLALQRGGEDAVEVLIEQLITAGAISERRGIFDALLQARAGREQLIPLLRHGKWFVVRNVAELLGEMGMPSAVADLAECLDHQDERVRKAAALALAKIGTPNTGEPLRRALKDKAPEVRVQVAIGVGAAGRRTTGLAMPLVVALQEEEDESVKREIVLALGRIGTPDAVQALIKVAQPSGFIFGRKPAPLRLAAVEALRLAATAPAIGTLEGMSNDGDKQVRAAAQAAVVELTKNKKPR